MSVIYKTKVRDTRAVAEAISKIGQSKGAQAIIHTMNGSFIVEFTSPNQIINYDIKTSVKKFIDEMRFGRWEFVKNGLHAESFIYYYKGADTDKASVKVFCTEGRWQYRITERITGARTGQRVWTNKGKGWKDLKTAKLQAMRALGHVLYELENKDQKQ